MKVVVTGATGFIGQQLLNTLREAGHEPVALSRKATAAKAVLGNEVAIVEADICQPGDWTEVLSGADVVVHLAGKPVMCRWTESNKKAILSSRVDSTRVLVEAMAALPQEQRPKTFVCASAIGYFGADRPGELLEEQSMAGDDFLAQVCKAWEGEAQKAGRHGIRQVSLRIGVVLGKNGGALGEMLMPGGFAVGGPIGRGDNQTSWVHIDDVVGLIHWAIDNAELHGPVNCAAPKPVTGMALAKAAAKTLGGIRLPLPGFMAPVMFGEASVVLTGSLKVAPKAALEGGYAFRYAKVEDALAEALG